jgi:hypothetical protein
MLSIIPRGYLSLLVGLGHFVEPILLVKIVPFFLIAISFIYLFFLGKKISGDIAGFAMSVLFILHSGTFQTFQGLTPRAFAYPLLFPFLFYLIKKKYFACWLIFNMQILFYPPIALLSLLTFIFSVFEVKKRKILFHCRSLIIWLLFFSSCLTVYIFQFKSLAKGAFGKVVGFQNMLIMPEFFPGGKTPFFFSNIIEFLQSKRSGIELSIPLLFILIVATLGLIFKFKKKIILGVPREIIFLFLSSLLLYSVSFFFVLHLYWPSRYIIFSLPAVCFIIIGILFARLIEQFFTRIPGSLAVVLFFLSTSLFYAPHINGRQSDYRYLRGALNFLAAQPEDSTVASTPFISDSFPVFAKKKVLFSQRLLMAFHKKYYEKMKNSVFEFYKAYYSDSMETLESFCSKYAVDYIVLDKFHFAPGFLKANQEQEPFNSYLLGLFSVEKKDYFLLPRITRDRLVFEDERIAIIQTSDLKLSK